MWQKNYHWCGVRVAIAVAVPEVVLVVVVLVAASKYFFKWCVSFFAASLLNVELRSEGCDDPGTAGCGRAFIKVNNQDYSLHTRGFNVAVFTEQGICDPLHPEVNNFNVSFILS